VPLRLNAEKLQLDLSVNVDLDSLMFPVNMDVHKVVYVELSLMNVRKTNTIALQMLTVSTLLNPSLVDAKMDIVMILLTTLLVLVESVIRLPISLQLLNVMLTIP